MTRENGVVAIPKSYFFKMAKLDYTSWRRALPREFYQNSVDAESSLIEVDADSKARSIIVRDNGCGMDYDTIKNKLLVFGGSKKEIGSVGAFGKAKEILFFSWEKYQIRTQDWLVIGGGAEYSIEQVSEWQDGTECTIWIWESEDFVGLKEQFEEVARYFQVACQINYLGDKVNTSLIRGKRIRSMDWGDLYLDEKRKSYELSVRIDGQWMFNEWFSPGHDLGKFILEVHGDSISVLTSNRDSLKGEYQRKYRELIAEFITETRSALEPERVIVREKFTGTGKVSVDASKVSEVIDNYLDDLMELPVGEIIDPEVVSDEVLERLPEENVDTIAIDRIIETAEMIVATKQKYWDYKDRFAFIGFQPDFHIVYDEKHKGNWKVDKFMKSAAASKLANAWTEVLKQILLDIEVYINFNVGFNFSITAAAAYERIDGVAYFYLNPQLLLADCKGKQRWQVRSKALLREDLILKGAHEVAHLTESSHNEDFVLKAEWIRARTWASMSIYPKIIKECFVSN